MLDQALLLEKTSRVLTGTYDFQKLAQQACDLIYKELKHDGFVGSGLFRVRPETNELYAYAYTAPSRRLIDALLPIQFSKLHLSMNADDNLTIRTARTGQSYESARFADFSRHALPDIVVDKIQKILKLKKCVSFPIFAKSGKVAGVLLCDFSDESAVARHVPLIQTFAKQLGLSFSNIFAFERLMNSYRKEKGANEATKDEANIPSVKFTLRLTPNQIKKLESLSRDRHKTKAEVIRDVIDKTA
ncbi:MAG: hypothetical protein A3A33_04475 [Candidatus Yanofskybacteria bacterium RIFCSPLOWO2_01_FULL_49_25]|uniref:Uncharacterized protein n=1 Tax=Candidatus Yanofskybacteria bacterium RIFCSPLOWO2_01_FULL_49_25 TaxID=1802701 RepID=A0A1F8GYH3_9BACT|nr:MAG: hypothetical protein A3A33_04475 [Candidatus Yanofskybacteria bacterium RIFCSPLOWO2_01_FULL_49_25]